MHTRATFGRMWPTRHRRLVRELLAEHGSEEALRRKLIAFALDTISAAPRVGPPASAHDTEVPSAEDVLADVGTSCGLMFRDFVVGRPSTILVFTETAPVLIGEEAANQVRVTNRGTRATVSSLASRTKTGNAVFSVSLNELRKLASIGGEPPLALFVLRTEGRVWVLTLGEVESVHEHLSAGKKAERFSLGPRGLLRVSMPRKPTGLDLAFPRVATVGDDS